MSDPSPSTPVKLYRTSSCPYCIMAAELMNHLGVEFEEVNLDQHPDRRGLTNSILPGHDTVPLVVVGDRPLGGFDELRVLHAAGELEQALRGS